MDQTQPILGKIDQVYAVTARRRPDPRLESAAIPPNGLIYVRGWVVGGEGNSIAVTIDNGTFFVCEVGEHRPDVAASLGLPPTASSEIEAFVEVPPLVNGTYALVLSSVSDQHFEALDTRDVKVIDPRPRTPLAPAPGGLLEIDRIDVGSRQLERDARALAPGRDDLVTIQGWAISGLELRAGALLYAVVDDRDALPLNYGRERGDVAGAYGSTAALACGFRAIIDPSPYPAGTRIVRFVLVMDDGRALACADSFALCLET